MITEQQWSQFFDLLDEIVHQPGTAKEICNMVIQKADATPRDQLNLEEFTAWFI